MVPRGGQRAGPTSESTQMESMCLSDIAENTREKQPSESTLSLSGATSANITPQKAYGQKAVSANAEEKARRIAAVCKKGVWQAWRGNPHGLEPIYSISLWQQTQTLMISCGLVDVLEMLLAGVTAQGCTPGPRSSPKMAGERWRPCVPPRVGGRRARSPTRTSHRQPFTLDSPNTHQIHIHSPISFENTEFAKCRPPAR